MLVVDAGRGVTVCVVGGVVVDAVVLESPGFHMLKVQNVGSVIFMDSGPVCQKKRLWFEQVESLSNLSLPYRKILYHLKNLHPL
jgi:hypothetical protein